MISLKQNTFRQIALPLLGALFLSLSSTVALATNAEQVVTRLHEEMQSVLADRTLETPQAKFDAIAPTMDDIFDFKVMVKTSVGRAWKSSDESVQKGLLRAFRNMSVANYVSQYADVPQNAFRMNGTREGPRELRLVDTTLETSDRKVSLTYVTRKKDGRWRIIDVLLDGKISELGVRRSEYRRILADQGPAGLILTLEKQTSVFLTK